MNTSVKVILFTSKTLSNGEHPVMIRIIKDRKPRYLSVGFSCHKTMWNKADREPQRKHPHYKEAKILIEKKKSDAQKLVLELEAEDKGLSADEIKSKLKRAKTSAVTLFTYFDNVVGRLKKSGQIKTADVYKDTKRNIEHFTGSKDRLFSEIDVSFLNAFESYLKQSGKGPNTIYIYLRTLRALINKAIKEEVCAEKYYAFKRFSLGKYSKIKTAKRAISKEEIEKIKRFNVKKHPELTDAKHIFLFSYYNRGMNFADIAFLKWTEINGNRLEYVRQKTKERFSIALLPPVLEILSYYKKANRHNRGGYVFPILDATHATPSAIYNRRVKMLRKINSDLKEIARLCKIKTNLTTYVARHSFATVLKKQGVNTSLISEMLGHDSEKTTQVYLDSFENKVLDELSKELL